MAAAGKIQDFGTEMRSGENGTERTFSNLRWPINLRIVLLGTALAEKIQVGNLLLGKMEFRLECSTKGRMNKSERRSAIREGKEITVVNTPDLLDPNIFFKELKMEMEQCTSLCFPGPHAFLIILREGAFEERDREAITLIEKIFGRSVFDHSLLVFTKHTHTSKMLKECLREATRHIQQLVDRCKKRYHLLNIDDVNNDSQVMELMRKIEEMRGGNPENFYRSSWLSIGAERIQLDLKTIFDKTLGHMQTEYNSQMFLKIKEMKRKQKIEEEKMKQTLEEEYSVKVNWMKQDYEEKYLEKKKKMKDEFQQKETEMDVQLLEMWGNKWIKTEMELTQTYEQIKDNVTAVLRKHRNQLEFLKYDEESKGEHPSKRNENLKQDQKTRISNTDQKTLAEKQKNEEWGNDLKQLNQSPEEAHSGMFETVWMECEVEWHQLKQRIQQKHEEDLIKREKFLKQKIKAKFNEREKEKKQQKDTILNQFSKTGIQEQASEPEYYFERQSQKNRNTMKQTLESNSLNKFTEEEKKQTMEKKEPKDMVQVTLWKDAKNENQKLKINEEDLKERKGKKSKTLVEEPCKEETVSALENRETNMFRFDLMRQNTCQTKSTKEVKTESDTKEKHANVDRERSQQHKEMRRKQVNETESRSGEPKLAFSGQESLKSNKDGNLSALENCETNMFRFDVMGPNTCQTKKVKYSGDMGFDKAQQDIHQDTEDVKRRNKQHEQNTQFAKPQDTQTDKKQLSKTEHEKQKKDEPIPKNEIGHFHKEEKTTGANNPQGKRSGNGNVQMKEEETLSGHQKCAILGMREKDKHTKLSMELGQQQINTLNVQNTTKQSTQILNKGPFNDQPGPKANKDGAQEINKSVVKENNKKARGSNQLPFGKHETDLTDSTKAVIQGQSEIKTTWEKDEDVGDGGVKKADQDPPKRKEDELMMKRKQEFEHEQLSKAQKQNRENENELRITEPESQKDETLIRQNENKQIYKEDMNTRTNNIQTQVHQEEYSKVDGGQEFSRSQNNVNVDSKEKETHTTTNKEYTEGDKTLQKGDMNKVKSNKDVDLKHSGQDINVTKTEVNKNKEGELSQISPEEHKISQCDDGIPKKTNINVETDKLKDITEEGVINTEQDVHLKTNTDGKQKKKRKQDLGNKNLITAQEHECEKQKELHKIKPEEKHEEISVTKQENDQVDTDDKATRRNNSERQKCQDETEEQSKSTKEVKTESDTKEKHANVDRERSQQHKEMHREQVNETESRSGEPKLAFSGQESLKSNKDGNLSALENCETNMFRFDPMGPNTCQTKKVKYSGDMGFDKAQQDIHQDTEDVKRRNKQHEQNTQFAKPQDTQTDKKDLSKTEHEKQKKDEPIPKNEIGHLHKEQKTTGANNPQGKRSGNGNVQMKEEETLSGHQKCAISGMREKDKHTKLSMELGQQQINTLNVQNTTKQSTQILNKGQFNDQPGPKQNKDGAQEINKSVVKENNKKARGSNQLPFGKHETDLTDSTKAVIQGQSEIKTTCEKDEDVGDGGVKKADQDPPKMKEDELMMKRKQEYEHEKLSEAQKQNREDENELRITEPESQKDETLIRQNENKQIYKEDMNTRTNNIQTQVHQEEYSKVDGEQEFSRSQNNVNVDSKEKETHTTTNKEYTERDKTLQKGDMNKVKSNKDVDLKHSGQDINVTKTEVNKNKEGELSQISPEEHKISQCDDGIPKKTNINVETDKLKDRTKEGVINTEQDVRTNTDGKKKKKRKQDLRNKNLITAQEHESEKQKGLSKIKPEEKHEEISVTKQENDQVDTDDKATRRNNSERQKCQNETEEQSKSTKEVKTESDTKEKHANVDRERSQQHKEMHREQVNETESRSGEPKLPFSGQELLKSNKDGDLQKGGLEMSKSPEEATVDGCGLNQTNTCCPDILQINVANNSDGIKDTEHKDVRKTVEDLHAGLIGETSEKNQTY